METKEKLLEQLEALKLFPKNKLVSQLRRQIQDKLKQLDIKKQITKPTKEETEISKEQIQESANQKRSSKLSRYWRYVKLIRDNFPNLKTSEIRKQLKIRQQRQQTKIPDAIWQNPSA